MSIDELIEKLQDIKKEHGNIDVLLEHGGMDCDIYQINVAEYFGGKKYVELV